MREFLSVSCLSLRATFKRVGRMACGLLAIVAFTMPVHAVDLLYATMTDGTVATFDVSSGVASTIASTKSPFASSGLNAPLGMAFDSGSNLYVTNSGDNTISKITPGGSVSPFASGFSFNDLFGLTIDSSDNLYVAMRAPMGNGTIQKITSVGGVSTYASGLTLPYGLTFDSSGNLYVSEQIDGSIRKITTDGSASSITSGLNSPTGLTIDSSGNLYVTDFMNNAISNVTQGGSVTSFASGLSGPIGLTFDSSGNLYAASQRDSTISKFNSTGGLVYSFSTGAAAPLFLTFAPTAVPEPSTYALGAIAAGVMGVIARRRKARKSA